MEKEYVKNIKPILDCYDKIREILTNEKIELPKIVVVGDQSSGKSSVLESITGVSLPRGENTVTKCPIVIQLRSATNLQDEHATVRRHGDNNPQEKFPLKELQIRIDKVQSELIAKEKVEIVDTAIYVSVKKLGAPDLTLYDLPGLTYKSEHLTTKIKQLIAKYTEGKETLILLVIPANSDLTTSEAISLIRKNEDFKDRTIAIITKIDLAVMQENNLYKKIMQNELNLKYNPIVVRNRNQQELEKNEDIEKIKDREIELIKNNTDLSRLPEGSKGTEQLIRTLITIQKDKLIGYKFDLREKILDKLSLFKAELKKLPLPAETLTEKLDRFKECLTKLTNQFTKLVGGLEINLEKKEFNVGSRLREKFNNFFEFFQTKHSRFLSDKFNKEIKDIINETKGLKLPNFFDSSAFHMIMSKEIETITIKTFDLVEDCKEYILTLLLFICNQAFEIYPNLNRAIQVELKNSLSDQAESSIKFLNDLLQTEIEGEWTINPYYSDIIVKINNEIKKKKENVSTAKIVASIGVEINDIKLKDDEFYTPCMMSSHSNDEMNVLNVQISSFAYWKVFEKRFVDYTQKIILNKLVYYYARDLALILDKKFSPSSGYENNFITEDFSISKKRHEIGESIRNLEMAKNELLTIM